MAGLPTLSPVAPPLLTALLVLPLGVAQEAGDRYEETIPGTEVSFEMAFAPGGEFVLGSPESEAGRDPDEGPAVTVVIQPFWIGVHEVTHEEYAVFRQPDASRERAAAPGGPAGVDAVARPSPPYEDPAHGLGHGRHPAVGMTQWAALQYARWLSEETGRLYRLPTEAEWEYACRAGGSTAYGFGDDPAGLDEAAWYESNGDETHHEVGAKSPNGWGIHDMHGNVAEWTLDEYRADFYASLADGAAPQAPAPWSRPQRTHPRTVRGGAFDDPAPDLRCAARLESTLDWKRRDPQIPKSRWWNTDSPHVGFRLVSPAGEMTREEIQAWWAEALPNG